MRSTRGFSVRRLAAGLITVCALAGCAESPVITDPGIHSIARTATSTPGYGYGYDTSGRATSTTSTSTRTTATTTPSNSRPEPVSATAANPLTQPVALTRHACRLPAWQPEPARVQAFLNEALRCLDSAWRPVLEKVRLPFKPAQVQVIDQVTIQDCGRPPEQNSFYCNGVIYLVPASYQQSVIAPVGVPTAAVSVLAHEYGHHLQQLSGTLPAAVAQIEAAGQRTPAGLELSRRAELQAQCLAGMFTGASFDSTTVSLAQRDNYGRGDAPGAIPDHGQPQNFGDWFGKGVQLDSLDACNTWIAASADVT